MSQGRRERILDEAAQWMALLQSGHAGAEERLAFQQWRQADAEHGAVFDRLSLGLQSFRDEPLHGLRAEQLIGALEAPSARRRFLQRSLALAAFGVATLALGRIGIVGFLARRPVYRHRTTPELPPGGWQPTGAGRAQPGTPRIRWLPASPALTRGPPAG